jgi:hypothetical protein
LDLSLTQNTRRVERSAPARKIIINLGDKEPDGSSRKRQSRYFEPSLLVCEIISAFGFGGIDYCTTVYAR